MLLWNVEGLKGILKITPTDIFNSSDILVLTETYLVKHIDLEGFYSIHSLAEKPQKGRPSGGVSIFYKPWIGPMETVHKEENLVIVKAETFTLIAIYARPNAEVEHIIEILTAALGKIRNAAENIIIAGDMNCRLDKPDTKCRATLNFLQEENFELINDPEQKTYISHNGSSTIDIVLIRGHGIQVVSQEALWSTSTTPMRKHIPIQTKLTLRANKTTRRRQKNTTSRKIVIAEIEKEKSRGRITEAEKEMEQDNLNAALTIINKIIKSGATHKPKRRRAQPWFDRECYALRQETLKDLHTAKNSGLQEDLRKYGGKRKTYKTFLKQKKLDYTEKEGERIAERALKDPYAATRPRRSTRTNNVTIDKWESHFTEILNTAQRNRAYDTDSSTQLPQATAFTEEEVRTAIHNTKNNKAPGPDQIYNEHLKESAEVMVGAWTKLYNKCVELGEIPEKWRTSTINILYKGKGEVNDPNSYRGIALENNSFKILTKLLNDKITEEVDAKIPEEQFGFRRGRGTLHAIDNLLKDIEEAKRYDKGKYYAIFVDYTKAFDLMDRWRVINKLEEMAGKTALTNLVKNILAYNLVIIDDMTSLSREVIQTNGVLQGDPLSPLLFNIATADVITAIRQKSNQVKTYMYADDMVIGSTVKGELQNAFSALVEWADENGLKINKTKTIQMVFRKGGRLAIDDNILHDKNKLEIVNSFKYLGVTLQTTGSFRIHIKERTVAALKAIYDIQHIQKLSLKTAILLFNTKILPTLTYGLTLIWEKLNKKDLHSIEGVKAKFLKTAMGVSKYTPSRLIYELAREPFLIEELRTLVPLPSTRNAEAHLRERRKKRDEIPAEFYGTDAMTDRNWINANQKMRHAIVKLAIHGFHHKICKNAAYHEPSEKCVCSLCGKHCEKYHINKCKKNTKSLSDYSKD